MSIQFPDTPTEGQTFTASNGVIYTYEDGGWKANAVSGLDDSYVNRTGDTMTGDLTLPNLISEGDVQTTSLNGGQLAGFRNQLINGDFKIAQRSADATAAVDSEYVAADRWAVGGAMRLQQATGVGAVCPGFSYGAIITSTASRNWVRQAVELSKAGNAGQFVSGSTWTVSIWSTKDVSLAVAFSDGVGFINQSTVQTNVAMTNTGRTLASGSGVYTYSLYTHTFTINSAPVASNNCLSVQLSIPLSDSALLSGVQFEPGPVATPFEHRPIGTELALCQRYYFKLKNSLRVPPDQGASSIGRTMTLPRGVVMRADPTETGTSGPGVASVTYSGKEDLIRIYGDANTAGSGFDIQNYTADAEL